MDAANAARIDWSAKTLAAMNVIETFAREASCYVGVSWGKDSVVVAHLVERLARERGLVLPIVWVRVRGRENPDCPLVRDCFLQGRRFLRYDEVHADAPASGLTSSLGFVEAARRYGDRHISGVRAQESGVRRIRTQRWGLATQRACAPLGWWKTDEVFAYLHYFDLPVHPAYACTMGGVYERQFLRVSAVGGSRGTGFGRREWERHYYGETLDSALGRGRPEEPRDPLTTRQRVRSDE